MPWRVLPVAVLRELSVEPGDDIEFDVLENRIAEIEPRLARARALALVGYRERCAAEVSSKLASDGYSAAAVGRVIEDLTAIGIIDDARFAEARARTLIEIRGLGRARALREMTACGLDRKRAIRALDACAPQEDERQRAALAAHRIARPRDTVNTLAQRLARKGYGVAVALQAARDEVGTGSGECGEPGWDDLHTPESTCGYPGE